MFQIVFPLMTLCKVQGLALCLLQPSSVLRFVPKAVLFDDERGKMPLNLVENTIPEIFLEKSQYSRSVLVKLCFLLWPWYFILGYLC